MNWFNTLISDISFWLIEKWNNVTQKIGEWAKEIFESIFVKE